MVAYSVKFHAIINTILHQKMCVLFVSNQRNRRSFCYAKMCIRLHVNVCWKQCTNERHGLSFSSKKIFNNWAMCMAKIYSEWIQRGIAMIDSVAIFQNFLNGPHRSILNYFVNILRLIKFPIFADTFFICYQQHCPNTRQRCSRLISSSIKCEMGNKIVATLGLICILQATNYKNVCVCLCKHALVHTLHNDLSSL